MTLRKRLAIAVALVLFGAGGCGPSDNERQQRALDDARDELAGTTFEDQHGTDGCTDDCAGHNAGYQWAQQNGVEDASGCTGDGDSFVEGCQAYATDLANKTEENLSVGR